MKKDVIITIKGTQKIDGELDSIELLTCGRFYRKDRDYFLSYDESETTGFAGRRTTVRIEDGQRVTMQRTGPILSQLIVEKGRRHQCIYNMGEGEDAVTVGPLTVSKAAYSVDYNNNQISMPPRELELLYFLCKNKGVAFTREALLDRVWDYDFMGDSRTVDVHVKRLRERLGEAAGMIQTVWGVGYKLVES